MADKSAQAGSASSSGDDVFNLDVQELVKNIEGSALPEAKKMTYLYLIAEGSFSLEHMEDLMADMDAAEVLLEEKCDLKRAEIASLDAQMENLEHEIYDLGVQASIDEYQQMEALIDALVHETESHQEAQESERIQELSRKLKS